MIEKFIDYVELTLSSGHGGAGAVSFRREKFIPHGGPDGGDGGRGGNVIIQVNPQISNFSHFRGKRVFRAQNGFPGMDNRKHGKNGENLILEVPLGTELKTQGKILLHDFDSIGEFLFLEGGKGGLGNFHFKSAIKQKPYYAQKGLPGRTAEVILEIKLIADIGLIGLPNAGKSTLLSVLTRAHPKIAAYPFTTLTPNLGVYCFADERIPTENNLIIADIPGLTENSHLGHGLGIEFLRHIERTGELFFLLESISDDPYHDFTLLQRELRSYSTKLYQKKFHILISKMDLINNSEEEKKLEEKLSVFPNKYQKSIIKISSINHNGFDQLRRILSTVWKRKFADK